MFIHESEPKGDSLHVVVPKSGCDEDLFERTRSLVGEKIPRFPRNGEPSTPPAAPPSYGMSNDHANGILSRRQLIQALGVAAIGAPLAAVFGQGRCRLNLGDPGCDTTAIKPVFDPTGWNTVGLDHIRIRVADYQKEAAFYTALMGWR